MLETSDASPNKFYVYVLFSFKDKGLYIGYSTNLQDRLQRHARGEVKSTTNRKPLKLIHYEYFINESDAKAREVFLKSGFGRDNLKKALQKTLSELQK
jgi:putative endonuclease